MSKLGIWSFKQTIKNIFRHYKIHVSVKVQYTLGLKPFKCLKQSSTVLCFGYNPGYTMTPKKLHCQKGNEVQRGFRDTRTTRNSS